MEPFPAENRAQLSADAFARLSALLRGHWALAQAPPIVPDMITQDEFSHDFVLRLPDGLYLAYDST